MNDVEKAERDLNNLEEQRESLFSSAKTLSKQRDAIAFAALTAGDKASKEKLRNINLEDVGLTANIASVEAALTVARANVAAAQRNEATAADKAKAETIAALNAKLKEQLNDADDAFVDAMASVLNAKELLAQLHALGVGPTDQLFRINVVTCIKTVIQELPSPYINDFEFARLSPLQKKHFKDLAAAWCDQIANQIAARLSEKKTEAA
ncbi:hypothetical protein SAMN05443247_06521 [Bradyrhizobium erythrophlei]|nr:hypothetical protein SAMN05443247_06521 [Bradyrhizobium erythrophlei]